MTTMLVCVEAAGQNMHLQRPGSSCRCFNLFCCRSGKFIVAGSRKPAPY